MKIDRALGSAVLPAVAAFAIFVIIALATGSGAGAAFGLGAAVGVIALIIGLAFRLAARRRQP